MDAIPFSQHRKTILIDDRQFVIQKFSAMTGLKITKVLTSKLLPMIGGAASLLTSEKDSKDFVMENLPAIFSPSGITAALDSVSGDDLDYIVQNSLMHCAEQLADGPCPVLRENGTFGIGDVQYNIPLTLRLTCEAVLWGLGDFFDASRLVSVLTPLASSWRSMQKTSTDTFSPQSSPDIGGNMNYGTAPTV